MYNINTTVRTDVGCSSFQLHFGYVPRLQTENPLPLMQDEKSEDTRRKDVIESRNKSQQRMTEISQKRIDKVNAKRRPSDLKPGDLLLKKPPTTGKFGTKFKGPYTLIDRNGETCVIQNKHKNDQRTVHIEQVKRFYERPTLLFDIFNSDPQTRDDQETYDADEEESDVNEETSSESEKHRVSVRTSSRVRRTPGHLRDFI